MKQHITFASLIVLFISLMGCTGTKTTTTSTSTRTTTKTNFKKNIPELKIEVDFNSPFTGNKEALFGEPGQPVNINFKNVNPNIYNVSVNDSLVIYDNQKSDELVNMFNKMPELKPVTAAGAAASPNAAAAASPSVRATTAFNNAGSEISSIDIELNDFLGPAYDNVKESFVKCVDFTDMPAELNGWALNCSLSLTDRITKANAYISAHLSGIAAAAAIPIGIESYVNQQITDCKRILMENEETGNDLMERYEDIKKSIDRSLSVDQYKEIEKVIEVKITKIKSVLENISKMKDKIKELEKAKPGAAIVEAYNKISTSEVNKTIPKYIPRKSGDEYLLKVNIEKKVTTANCNNEPTSFTIPVYVEKGIKIDFSTGVVFNFGKDKFFDQKYRYDSVYRANGSISDSVQISKKASNNVSQVSIGAFGHVYTRIRREINLGAMFGVSLSADQRVYYHAGLSALIGKNDRFVISGGVSIAKAKYLDTQYDVNQIMKRSLAPTAIPTEEVTRAGFFLSMSYNLNLIK